MSRQVSLQHLIVCAATAICSLGSRPANAQSNIRREQRVTFVAVGSAIRPHVVMPSLQGAPVIVYLPDDSLSVGVVARMLTVASFSTKSEAPAVSHAGQTLLRSKSAGGQATSKGMASAARIVRRLSEAAFEPYGGYARARRTTITLALAPSAFGAPSRVFRP